MSRRIIREKVLCAFRAPWALRRKIEELAQKNRVSMSEVMIQIIDGYEEEDD